MLISLSPIGNKSLVKPSQLKPHIKNRLKSALHIIHTPSIWLDAIHQRSTSTLPYSRPELVCQTTCTSPAAFTRPDMWRARPVEFTAAPNDSRHFKRSPCPAWNIISCSKMLFISARFWLGSVYWEGDYSCSYYLIMF